MYESPPLRIQNHVPPKYYLSRVKPPICLHERVPGELYPRSFTWLKHFKGFEFSSIFLKWLKLWKFATQWKSCHQTVPWLIEGRLCQNDVIYQRTSVLMLRCYPVKTRAKRHSSERGGAAYWHVPIIVYIIRIFLYIFLYTYYTLRVTYIWSNTANIENPNDPCFGMFELIHKGGGSPPNNVAQPLRVNENSPDLPVWQRARSHV